MVRNASRFPSPTPRDRLTEAAAILATAIVRLRVRAALPRRDAAVAVSEKQIESVSNCLDVAQGTVLSVPHGLTVRDLDGR
jgi:hypothetical protein